MLDHDRQYRPGATRSAVRPFARSRHHAGRSNDVTADEHDACSPSMTLRHPRVFNQRGAQQGGRDAKGLWVPTQTRRSGRFRRLRLSRTKLRSRNASNGPASPDLHAGGARSVIHSGCQAD